MINPSALVSLRAMIRRASLLLISALFLWGCASSNQVRPDQLKGPDPVASNKVEPQARTLFFQAERAFLGKDYEKAIRGFQAVRTKFPNARNASLVSSYRLGTIYYYQEEYSAAAREFDAFLQRYPQSELGFDVRYNLAACEYQLGNYERAYRTLSGFKLPEIRAQGTRRAEVVYQLAALSAEAIGNHTAAVAAYAAEAQLPIDERKRETLLGNVDQHLAQITTSSALDRLLSEITEPVVRGKITQRMNQLATAAAPVQSAPVASGGETTAGLPLSGSSRSDRLNIGVILPLTGNMARYGERALEGILLAAGTFQSSREHDFKLFIEDSQSNPEIAKRAVDNLYNRDNVVAILGPLSWNESVAVADRAQQLGILNLSLTGKEGVSSRGAYLFQNALTPRVQLESLVNHTMKEKNFKRFAILAPNNPFGKDMAAEFWDLVEKNGGHIVGYRLYPPDEKDFQEYVQRLVGLSNPKFRTLEMTRLAEYKKEAKEKTGREPKADIPPIIDFDAIFLPDSPSTVSQIAASLAYYDVTNVPMLGTTEWNSDQLYKRGGRYVEGALFPGGLSSASKNETQKNFIRQFAAAYGGAPDLLATQAYEAMFILSGALKETSSSDRNDVVKEMSKMSGFLTPLGSLSFDATRIARRKLSVYKLEMGGNIVEQ